MVSCIRHIFQSADLQREDGQSGRRGYGTLPW